MAKAKLPEIQRFLSGKRIAVVGVSRSASHFSRALFRDLQKRGYETYPVNPKAEEIDGARCYPSVQAIGHPVDGVLIMTPAEKTAAVCADCVKAGVPRVWMYKAVGHGAVDARAAESLRKGGVEVVEGECPYMFLEDTQWFHRMHGGILKLIGKYPAQA